MAETGQVVRGRLFGTHCAGCRTAFTDEDAPTFTGPFAVVAATGWTMTCRYCRQRSDMRQPATLAAEMDRFAEAARNLTRSAGADLAALIERFRKGLTR